jgi:glycosyltransferase involved in cell wall biosynthesis
VSLRVLALVPQPIVTASGRYRIFQMVAPLAAHGIELETRPFLDDAALARLYLPGGAAAKALDIVRGSMRRWRDLGIADRYRVALVHREIWPVIGSAPMHRLARRQPRFVFDFDDAVWLANVSEANRAWAWLKPFGQPAWLAARAGGVAAGNGFLAAWARERRPGLDPAAVEVVPTAVDTDRWRPHERGAGPPRLVWIGSPSTVVHLDTMAAALERVAARHPEVELHVIGARCAVRQMRVVHHDWSEATEVDIVARADVGLAPLPDSEWTRGKCGLKLLLSMACGLPSVASRAGVHPEMVRDGVDGLLADTPDEFAAGVERLLGDAALRARLGGAARATVEERYSVRAVAPRLAALLRRTAETAA